MTLAVSSKTLLILRRPRFGLAALVLSVALVSVVVGDLSQTGSGRRIAITFCVLAALLGLSWRSPRAGFLTLVLWGTALGMIRRIVDAFTPPTATDPLLLVLPIVLVVLVGAAARRGTFRNLQSLAKSVLVLDCLILLGALNPLQGGLRVGLAGLLFVLIPTLGFWFGRIFCDDRLLRSVLLLIALLGVAVAFYGLAQSLVGFPSWDKQWVTASNLVSLNVNGSIRPFSSLSSPAEYGTFLIIAVLAWVLFAGRRVAVAPLSLGALCLLIPALVYQSSRGAVVALVLALGVIAGAWRRLPLVATGLFAVGLMLALVFAVRSYAPATPGSGQGSGLIYHEAAGLGNPLNAQSSTAVGHLRLMVNGIKHAFTNPVGEGIGTINIAGDKFGGVVQGTEADPSNVAVALGLPGLVAYLAIVGLGFSKAYRLATRARSTAALAALGLMTVTILQWLNGGEYAVAFLPWLALGWVDRRGTAQAEALDIGREAAHA